MPRLRRASSAALLLFVAPLGAAAQGPGALTPDDFFIDSQVVAESTLDAMQRLLQADRPDAATTDQIVDVAAPDEPRFRALTGPAGVRDWSPAATPPEWLREASVTSALRGHIALSAAARLHAAAHYEECLAWLEGVEPEHVVAPHLLHFYRAVAQHQLVRLAEAKENAERLLKIRDQAARRHVVVAELIVRDATGVEPESLDHLARTMNDVRRRLELGRSAQPEQDLQQQVLDALDKMIEEAEKQQQQQQQQQQASAGAPSAPSKAMQDSRPGELKGPGEVDPRDVAAGGDWGSLPPEERERVTQQIGRDFPGYYRDLIEAYFRSLATPPPADGEDGDSTDSNRR